MIAVDTNILARYLLNDDRKQAQIAAAIVEGDEDLTAPVTVFLELVWVLESCGNTRAEVARALRLLLGLPNFKPREAESLWFALASFDRGMDFADALHLALSAADKKFVTFDRHLAKLARNIGTSLPVTEAK